MTNPKSVWAVGSNEVHYPNPEADERTYCNRVTTRRSIYTYGSLCYKCFDNVRPFLYPYKPNPPSPSPTEAAEYADMNRELYRLAVTLLNHRAMSRETYDLLRVISRGNRVFS